MKRTTRFGLLVLVACLATGTAGCRRAPAASAVRIVGAAFTRAIPADRAQLVPLVTLGCEESTAFCVVELASASDTAQLSFHLVVDDVPGIAAGTEVISAIKQDCRSETSLYSFRVHPTSPLQPGRYRGEISLWDGCCDGWVGDSREVVLIVV